MSKPASVPPVPSLKTYTSRFRGSLVLVCRKCEKRFKASSSHPFKLKKILKRVQRDDPDPQPLHVLSSACMKLCPKDGITVCPQTQLSRSSPPSLFILRTEDDVRSLYRQEMLSGAV